MIEREFRISFDFKLPKGKKGHLLSIGDIMNERKNKTDIEISLKTPDGRWHSRFITRKNLACIMRLNVEMYLEDTVLWKTQKWEMQNGVRI